MKKLATLLIAAGLVFGVATGASAIDFKAKGQWLMNFDYGQHGNFAKNNGKYGKTGYNGAQDEFNASQRVRLQLDAVASEALSGTLYFEMGDQTWGKSSQGGALGADGKVVEIKQAYIDFIVPDTDLKVRMGIQGLAAPSFALKKAQSFGDDVAGITASYAFNENVAATVFWARPFNDNGSTKNGTANYMDNVDVFGLMLPLTFDGVKVTPWAMMAAIGPNAFRAEDKDAGKYTNFNAASIADSASKNFVLKGMLPAFGVAGSGVKHNVNDLRNDEYATAWWAGLTADVTAYDPFHFALDFTAGGVSWDNSRLNRAGWMVAAVAEYKLDWGTPGLVGWYASGDDDDLGNGSERLPTLSASAGDNEFSNYAFDGHKYIGRDGTLGNNMAGTWGLGLRVRDMSFLEDLKHTFRLNYIGGTNEQNVLKKSALSDNFMKGSSIGTENAYLTNMDSALEIGLNTTYKMYENLTVALDMNYLAMFIDDTSKKYGSKVGLYDKRDVNDAWNVNVTFAYEF